jgi:hypothetical protein
MSKALAAKASTQKHTVPAGYADFRGDIVALLSAARQAAARHVNALMTASYWEIGRRIVEAEQKGKRRAGYGEQLIERLSIDLTQQFGRGFSGQNLWQMRLFFETFKPEKILQTVSGELTLANLAQRFALPWSAYVRLLTVKDDYARRRRLRASRNNGARNACVGSRIEMHLSPKLHPIFPTFCWVPACAGTTIGELTSGQQ